MMTKTGMNLQDSFLNQVRKDNQEILLVLLDGTRLNGHVRGFDNFTVILGARGQQHLIYKHAIAQIISRRPPAHAEDEHNAQEGARSQTPEGESQTPSEMLPDGQEERRREERPRREGHHRREENARERERKEESAARDRFNAIDLSSIKVNDPKG